MLSHFRPNSLQLHDCILPGSCVNGIHQTRMLGWIAVPSSGKEPTSLSLGLLHWQAGSLPLAPPRKPSYYIKCMQINLSKRKTNRAKPRGNQAKTTKVHLSAESHRTCLNLPATSYGRCEVLSTRKLIGDSG